MESAEGLWCFWLQRPHPGQFSLVSIPHEVSDTLHQRAITAAPCSG